MANAQEFIESSLYEIGVKAAETPLTEEDLTDGIEKLNDMISELTFDLRYSEVDDPLDEITIFRWANAMVKTRLAIRLAPRYSKIVTPALELAARTSYKLVLDRVVTMSKAAFPNTLPVGRGNQGWGRNGRAFFTDETQDDILTGGGENLLTETGEQLEEEL